MSELTKIDFEVNNVSQLEDTPNANDGMTPEEVKNVIDKGNVDIKNYINDVLTTEIDEKINELYSYTDDDKATKEEVSNQYDRITSERNEDLSRYTTLAKLENEHTKITAESKERHYTKEEIEQMLSLFAKQTIRNVNSIIICTSKTRPTDADLGQHIFETDTNLTLKNVGTVSAPDWSTVGESEPNVDFNPLDGVQIQSGVIYNAGAGWNSYTFDDEFDNVPEVIANVIDDTYRVQIKCITNIGFLYRVVKDEVSTDLTITPTTVSRYTSSSSSWSGTNTTIVTDVTGSAESERREETTNEEIQINFIAIYDSRKDI